MQIGLSVDYDQVNLIAQPQSRLSSRTEVPDELSRIAVAPMQAVVGFEFAKEALRLGLTVCLHRFGSLDVRLNLLLRLREEAPPNSLNRLYFSLGLNDWDAAKKLKEIGHNYILVDVANGYLLSVVEFVEKLQCEFFNVMTGNVHTDAGYNLYRGPLSIRVGIGGGSVCKTGSVTGYTRGQFTELYEIYEASTKMGKSGIQPPVIVADGGIRDSGCAAKAFGLGADMVMLGGYFSTAVEAQNVIDGSFCLWGGASEYQQVRHKGVVTRHSEGVMKEIDRSKIKPLAVLVSEFWGGLQSAVSYSGHSSLSNFIGNGVFEVKK